MLTFQGITGACEFTKKYSDWRWWCAQILNIVRTHGDSAITSLVWSEDSKKVITGDDKGLVMSTPVTAKVRTLVMVLAPSIVFL